MVVYGKSSGVQISRSFLHDGDGGIILYGNLYCISAFSSEYEHTGYPETTNATNNNKRS